MFTFQKRERLCHRKTIQLLFTHEVSKFFVYPLKVAYTKIDLQQAFPIQVLLVVSKRYHPHAAKRNYIKRMKREAYRKNKHILIEVLQAHHSQIALMINYTEHDILSYKKIEGKIILTLQRLCELYEKNSR